MIEINLLPKKYWLVKFKLEIFSWLILIFFIGLGYCYLNQEVKRYDIKIARLHHVLKKIPAKTPILPAIEQQQWFIIRSLNFLTTKHLEEFDIKITGRTSCLITGKISETLELFYLTHAAKEVGFSPHFKELKQLPNHGYQFSLSLT